MQSAIDACSLAGGGRVVFSSGNYLTTTVFLKSRVVLEDTEDVGITGGCEINGQGLEFVVKFDERKNVMVSWNQTGAYTGDECRS
ncbi:hypothetical protein L6452_42419 [Arctium lappa]|uniref:Uncharacterized protein n=1 Tax=Arctium lappa TaxID=4217 RepID=A0ACB8XHL0_ARCLA|nr:hypothetical protein L6452_42419 [Arctium lappa]